MLNKSMITAIMGRAAHTCRPGRGIFRVFLTIVVVSVFLSLVNNRKNMAMVEVYQSPDGGKEPTILSPSLNESWFISVFAQKYYVPYSATDAQNITVVMLTHNRDAFVSKALRHYHSIPIVAEIVLYINEAPDTTHIDALLKENGLTDKVRAIALPGNNLMERFKPTPGLKTEAVFSVDDDILVDEKKLLAAFRLWKGNSRSIVGFPFRLHAKKDGTWQYKWRPEREYSMVLTGAAFYHRGYQSLLSETLPEGIASKVRRWVNCEDIAFNMHIAAYCNCDPIMAVRPRKGSSYTHLSKAKNSLSGRKNHDKARSQCIEDFSHFYHEMPLHVKKTFYVLISK